MPNDPGPSVQLQITPVAINGLGATRANAGTYPPAITEQPATIVVSQQPDPTYEQRVYYPPISVDVGLGYWSGYGGHRHWR
jgi:hypothetical protein